MTERELFYAVFRNFQADYCGLDMKGTLVYYKGECKFNTDGFNLRHNLKMLCKTLEN